jgi:L-amino acid N-acyltransferase
MSALQIRLASVSDLPTVNEIYNHFVRTSTATFQIEPESLPTRQSWFRSRSDREPVTVLVVGDEILAWAALSLHKSRAGYRQTAETSVYVRHDCHRCGYGRAMLADLIEGARALGYHALLAGCCAEATSSIALHEALGFRRVAHFREVGRKFERWLDVIYLQLLL